MINLSVLDLKTLCNYVRFGYAMVAVRHVGEPEHLRREVKLWLFAPFLVVVTTQVGLQASAFIAYRQL